MRESSFSLFLDVFRMFELSCVSIGKRGGMYLAVSKEVVLVLTGSCCSA